MYAKRILFNGYNLNSSFLTRRDSIFIENVYYILRILQSIYRPDGTLNVACFLVFYKYLIPMGSEKNRFDLFLYNACYYLIF